MTEPIPGPRGYPLIGNLFDIKHEEGSLKGLENLADIYGPVCQINIAGRRQVLISSAELLLQFTDEKQFVKIRPVALGNDGGPQGLFTARGDDPDWGQAHRILAPAFGPLAVESMFEGMKDIAFQLCLKWARTDESRDVSLTDDFTRLTLDTIALCTMDYRFNSFYSADQMHPFIDAMLNFLVTSGRYSSRPAIVKTFMGSGEQDLIKSSAQTMNKVSQSIIDKRRSEPTDKQDMLNVMLHGKDPKTGQAMRDELIAAEMITFLIAGHETTSGALSFLFVELMQNPKAYLAAQQEVDRLLGKGPIKMQHMKELKYLNAALREALRLHPTAPVITKSIPPARQNEYVTICDGKYHLENDLAVRLLLGKCMRDTSYFGKDAEQFDPWHMHEDNPDYSKHMKAFKAFGNGSRACIGQNFAWQEAIMVAALVLQNFEVNLSDPGYKLKLKQTLTIKPDNLKARFKLRKGLDATELEKRLHTGQNVEAIKQDDTTQNMTTNGASTTTDLQILYGTNQGTCQALAQRLASHASRSGLKAVVADLDSAVDSLSKDRATVIVTPSYEGEPPENAARFVAWLESSSCQGLEGVKYAVFGCGHRDWHDTFHRIPRLIDSKLEEKGATRMIDVGLCDVASGMVIDDFTRWQKQLLTHLRGDDESVTLVKSEDLAEISMDQRAQQLSNGLSCGTVKDVKVLTAPGNPEKRHLEIELPAHFEYEAGDYLAVLPMNPDKLVHQIMNHWNLSRDATITFKSQIFSNLPVGDALSIHELLKGSFELSQSISRSNIEDARAYTKDPDTLKELENLLKDDKAFDQLANQDHMSLFGLLSKHKTIEMPFANFLTSLLPLRVRQYSISSTPLAGPNRCTITYSVVKHGNVDDQPGDIEHEGVASTFLSTLSVGDTVSVAVKRTATANSSCAFRLPPASLQSNTPLLMFCAGSGLAPFRGFIQQRATMLEENKDLKLAPALLFVGCRSATGDRLYPDEFEKWQKLGAVDVRYAFSKEPDHPLADGCKYVGDRMVKDIDDVRDLWKSGAKVYFCGSRRVQQNVSERLREVMHDIWKAAGMSDEDIRERGKEMNAEFAQRAVSDIFD